MFQKRIVVCLDVRDGKTTKGVKFKGNVDIGDPVEMAADYYEQGVDELVFYDITASSEGKAVLRRAVFGAKSTPSAVMDTRELLFDCLDSVADQPCTRAR